MTNYNSRRRGWRHSKLRDQRIREGGVWTTPLSRGTGLSYTVSDSAGCVPFAGRMFNELDMDAPSNTTNGVLRSRIGVTPKLATAETDTYSVLYTLYSNSIIRNTEYYLSYYCVRVCSRGGVAA